MVKTYKPKVLLFFQNLKNFHCIAMHIYTQLLFWAGNQGNHLNFDPSLLAKSLWLIFMGMKQKSLDFQTRLFLFFFVKILEIGPWTSRIDFCKVHWCSSTWMVVRLSNVSSETGKKIIFCGFRLFLSFCPTPSWPYRLSHINVLCINQSKDQSLKFLKKKIENWWNWKTRFFFSRPFWICFQNENQSEVLGWQGWVEICFPAQNNSCV